MKEEVKAWLMEMHTPAGALACGVWFSDQTTLCHSYAKDFPVLAVEKVFRSVTDTFRVLALHRLPSERLRWVYEKVTLHCWRRQDGLVFGIFLPRLVSSADTQQIERLSQAFSALKRASLREDC
jgi:hypothetical protein